MDLSYEDNIFSMLNGNIDDYLSFGYLRGYDRFIDSYSLYQEDLPRKAMCTTFFSPSYDFSHTFDKVKRILIVFGVIFIFASCIF